MVRSQEAVQLLDRVEEMKAITQRLHEAERPRFRIGFVPSTLYGRLPELIRRYRAVRPGVELTLLELTTLEQIAALKEGRIDVGYGRIPFDDAAIERTLLRNERLSAALPSEHTLIARPSSHRLLAGRRWIRTLGPGEGKLNHASFTLTATGGPRGDPKPARADCWRCDSSGYG